MKEQPAAILENLLRANGLAWMMDAYHPADKVLRGLLELLERVAAEYQRRLGLKVSFSPPQLEAEAKRNPHKVKAFLQALGFSNSPEMLVMVWRILQGLSVREVKVNYREHEGFALDVCLVLPGDGEDLERYHSTDINDATLLRHFGVATINGEPLFEGFYPLRVKDDANAAPVATSN
ncbi:MAG TPA: hypothetical protein PK867_15160 [Pirellulales bacterium]|nr:hypothetical protein [Pirellulales bacterium]